FAVINSKALEILSIDEHIQDPKGGRFGRDSYGHLNGVLYETALGMVNEQLPALTEESYITQIGVAAQKYLAHGITAANDAAVRSKLDFSSHLKASKNNINPLKMRLMIMHDLLQEDKFFRKFSAVELDQYLSDYTDGRTR